jgi:hypothetical protein
LRKIRLIKTNRFHLVGGVKHVFSRISLSAENKRKIFLRNPLKLGMKANSILSIAIILMMLVSVFAWLSAGTQSEPNFVQPISNDPTDSPSPTHTQTPNPTQSKASSESSDFSQILSRAVVNIENAIIPSKPLGLIESAPFMNSTVWTAVAANAWAYYKPGVGVDPNTGLPYAGGKDFKAFTDWDLGSYIQATINSQKLGLAGDDPVWGAYARLNNTLTFLENRPLNTTTGYPFWFYDATNGNGYQTNTSFASNNVDVVDTGRLFVALNNLRNFNSSFTTRIDKIVLFGQNYNRSNYAALVSDIQSCVSEKSLYAYYITSGFASFWPQQLGHVPGAILDNILLKTQNTTVNGVALPNMPICNEPLLSSVFEITNADSSRLKGLMAQVYLAHEAYYNATGTFTATSEGYSPQHEWVYEWVIAPNGQPWNITNGAQTLYYDITPVVYTKVTYSFLALYNTTFARSMAVWLEQTLLDPKNGYYDGADIAGSTINISNIGNTLILNAAVYALNK